MKKKNLLALLLACIMCFSSNVAIANAYKAKDDNVLGGTATMEGVLSTRTEFYGNTSLTVNKIVDVFVDVYTNALEGEVYVGFAENWGCKTCRIDQNASSLPSAGTYAVSSIMFTHGAYSDENKTNRVFNYTRTLKV